MAHAAKNSPPGNAVPAAVVDDVACTGCSAVCDDLRVAIDPAGTTRLNVQCTRAEAWLAEGLKAVAQNPLITVDGQSTTLDQALHRAAEILSTARAPLVYGLAGTNCEAQRQAVALADALRALIDTPTSHLHGPVGMALHAVGQVTCSLGEVRHRGDAIVFWRCDPATTHPRYLERYATDAAGVFIPQGRAGRWCLSIDSTRHATAARADEFVQLAPGRDFEALWTLRALLKNLPLDADRVQRQTGVPLERWKAIARRLQGAHFRVLVFDEHLAQSPGRELNLEALEALARDLNEHHRAVCTSLHHSAGATGAESVLLWQTGYPFAVNLVRGFPRYNGREFSAPDLVRRGEVDAMLVVAADPVAEWPEEARRVLATIPTICFDAHDSATRRLAQVAVATAPYGFAAGGTVHRTDEVPLPLRPVIQSALPSDEELLAALLAKLARH